MQKREADFLSMYVGAWIKQYSKRTGEQVTCEAKETGTTIGDNDFEPQQLPSLRASETDTGYYCKIPDGSGIAVGFDSFLIRNAHAFVAIMFRDKGWAMIRINDWDNRKQKRVSFEDSKLLTKYWYGK